MTLTFHLPSVLNIGGLLFFACICAFVLWALWTAGAAFCMDLPVGAFFAVTRWLVTVIGFGVGVWLGTLLL